MTSCSARSHFTYLVILNFHKRARFGYDHDLLVLVEGFYETDIYGQMLERLKKLFAPQVFAYYYDLSFEETVRRHQTRAKQEEFTLADMKRWWKDRDFLGWEEESFFTDEDSLETAFQRICQDLGKFESSSNFKSDISV